MSNKKKKIIGAVAGIVLICALVVAMVFVWDSFKEKPTEGSKNITIEVVDNEGTSTVYEVNTDAEYLQQAMDEAEGLVYDGEESEYGFTVSTVNGIRADYNLDGAYWGFYVNDEYCNYGISQQPVNDKDAFKIEYTIGY